MDRLGVMRHALRRLSRGRVIRRRLPADLSGRAICVSPEAALRYWSRDLEAYDPMLLQVVRDHVREGMNVWDIGANCGVFTYAAAARVGRAGRVIGLEPDTFLLDVLRRTHREQPDLAASVTLVPAAVSDQLGLCTFHIAKGGRAANFVGDAGRAEACGTLAEQTVLAVTLDWLHEQVGRPDFIKIDVEGHEVAVLAGATQVLQAKPALLVEVGKESKQAVLERLRSFDYRFFSPDDGQLQQELAEPPDNFIAVAS